ncbi:ASCH domain-containing protein [Oceanospirillum sediminis]|uniref:ASCH domain-containing protein n=1 Tax=Oceanospirillum sediminis TaxID=2760088 RepID=A0A839IRK8_9GAMM|nr:ASCH domain-containing protein [Oceanospirillum sediminis]MBB1487129.1 ASCH domain-containing protein [Oceanospirillum sediminis]
MNKIQEKYLRVYLESLPPEQANRPRNMIADYFCADEENASICADLILKGEKTATCSMKYWYESGLELMPEVGTLQVVTDWYGNPTSIIETTDVSECKFSEVTAEFASAEGEGDKSLAWWRKTHWDFFSAECEEQGLEPDDNMILVLERFRVVYS